MTWRALVVIGLVFGCQSKPEETPKNPPKDTPTATEKRVEAPAKAEPKAEPVKPKPEPVAKAEPEPEKEPEVELPPGLEGRLLSVANCKPEDDASGALSKRCGAFRSFRSAAKRALKSGSEKADFQRKLGHKYLKHETPAVRVAAAHLLVTAKPTDAEWWAVLEAAKAEKDGHGLDGLLSLLDDEIDANPALGAFYLKLAKHAHPAVREHVAQTLSRPVAAGVKGRVAALIKMAEKDTKAGPRNTACQRLGPIGDARALPVLEKLTASSNKDPEWRAACFAGLVGLWSNSRPHEAPVKGAWALTLKHLNKSPRTADFPPREAIAGMGFAKQAKFQAAARWYDNGLTVAALVAVVLDRTVDAKARATAVRTMKELGAATSQFEKLKKNYANADGPDIAVQSQITRAL